MSDMIGRILSDANVRDNASIEGVAMQEVAAVPWFSES